MFEIRHVTDQNQELAKSFLLKVPAITEVDESILKKASLLYSEDEIAGTISFETFHDFALIRYFIFKKSIDFFAIKELFDSLEKTIIDENIDYIFSVVNTEEIEELFSSFDFKEIDKDSVFLEEEKFSHSRFKDAKVMLKKVQLKG